MKQMSYKNKDILEFILANINDAVFLTESDGAFLYVCPNVDIIFGQNAQDVERLGNISALIGENAFSLDMLRHNGELLNVEWVVLDKRGTRRTVLAHVRSVPYENRETILFILRDITLKKHLEKDLRAYQRIVSATDDFISLVDDTYRYRIVNSAYSRRTQQPADLILGRTVAEVLGGDVFRELIKDRLDRCLRGETIRYQAWFEFPEAGARFLDMTYMPYVENDAIRGVVVNGRDITELKQHEMALEESYRELETRAELAKLFLTAPQGRLFSDILTLLRRKFSSAYGYIGYIDNAGDLVCPSMTEDLWQQCRIPEKRWVFPRDCWGGIWGESLVQKSSVLRNGNLNPPEGHLPLKNALVVPLLANDELIGQIALANTSTGYRRDDQARLESIAEFIAPVLKIHLDKEAAQKSLGDHADKLEERNIALKVLLENRKEERQKIGETMLRNFEKLVFPYYERLATCRSKEELRTLLDILAANTRDCLAPLETSTSILYRLLTPMESHVADLIKAGKTSKEIAALLAISPRAVYFHRNNIRKKLKLQNTKANLRSLLTSYR